MTNLKVHRATLVLASATCLFMTLPALLWGELKSLNEVDWLDILGEGGVALAVGLWSLLILSSRPAGRVTRLLFVGMATLFMALWLDAADELIHLDALPAWYRNLESVGMPLSMTLLTWGLLHWHREQLGINRQLSSREGLFREHRLLDPLSQLGSADYLCQQLQQLQTQLESQPLSAIMLSLNNWSEVSRCHGHQEADRLLDHISELIMLHLQSGQWLSRYAGSQLVVVMPNTTAEEAGRMVIKLAHAIELLELETTKNLVKQTGNAVVSARISAVYQRWQGESPNTWLRNMSAELHQQNVQTWAA